MMNWRCQRVVRYVWALPMTLIGLLLALPLRLLGARCVWYCGVCEVSAPARWRCARWRFAAITVGHVVIAADASQMARLRVHERVHVRQYERWGLMFWPLYLGSSCWQWLRGRRFYRDNYFEREAYGDLPLSRRRSQRRL